LHGTKVRNSKEFYKFAYFINHKNMSKKIIVASQNPVKIKAAHSGFAQMMPESTFEFVGLSVPSGVSDQPITDIETYQGAENRVLKAKEENPDASFWVGIEGGIEEKGSEMYAFAWIVILSLHQKGISRTATFQIPPKIASLIREGVELGKADDIVFGHTNSKHHLGSVGILTKGLIDRMQLYTPAVCFALIPFVNADLFLEEESK